MKASKALGKPEETQAKAVERKAAVSKVKAASHAKKANKPKPRKGTKPKKARKEKPARAPASLDKKAEILAAEINGVRKRIVENESALAKKTIEKIKAEDALNKLLMQNFGEEKALLASIKSSSAKKQESLRQKISSLENIAKIYEEKSARIEEAKRKHAALKRQLELIEKHAGV